MSYVTCLEVVPGFVRRHQIDADCKMQSIRTFWYILIHPICRQLRKYKKRTGSSVFFSSFCDVFLCFVVGRAVLMMSLSNKSLCTMLTSLRFNWSQAFVLYFLLRCACSAPSNARSQVLRLGGDKLSGWQDFLFLLHAENKFFLDIKSGVHCPWMPSGCYRRVCGALGNARSRYSEVN